MGESENKFNPEIQSKLNELLLSSNSLKNDWSNEIPDEIKHSVDENHNWKVRSSWFQQIIWVYEELDYLLSGNLPEDLKKDFDYFYTETASKLHGKTTTDQITAGDKMLDHIISFIQRKL